jgi:excinuclease ABC subunit A
VYDYLRLLWARAGRPFCQRCGAPVVRDTPESVVGAVLGERDAGSGEREAGSGERGAGSGEPAEASLPRGTRFQVCFPVPPSARATPEALVENLRALGFVRVLADGVPLRLDQGGEPKEGSGERGGGSGKQAPLADTEEILVVVDRLVAEPSASARLGEAVRLAFTEGEGACLILHEGGRQRFTEFLACSACDTPALSITPALFSFNNPRGACGGCNGFGAVLEYDESLIVPDPSMSLADGAIDPWTKPRYETRRKMLLEAARKLGADPQAPWSKLKAAARRELLHGSVGRFTGIFPFLKGLEVKRYKQYVRVFLRQYQRALLCPACQGTRLNPHALAVRVGGRTIADAAAMTVEALALWLSSLDLTVSERQIATLILAELAARTRFLLDVGLGYLTLDRQTRTLSGGEAQRIALSNALGARLVDALYVLDEPTIGLHPRDTERLLGLLRRLRDAGNTVVVVEHDPAAIAAADFMLELGPGSGERGGSVVHAGPPAEATETLTGQYLSGRRRIGVPSMRRPAGPLWLRVRGAQLHNLAGVDVDIPLGTLTAVTGVSGSGKSTLVHDVLYRQLEARMHGGHSAKSHLGEEVGEVASLTGWERLSDVLLVDQSPIGRSPRSNPVTYAKAFDEIRDLFAAQPLARARGYTAATFSFNLAGGRCETCEGAGHVQVEMVFLADVFVPCESCNGTRFRRDVLEVKINGCSVHDVLQWTVDEAIARFRHQPKLGAALWQLQQVGLGYLRLGQPATTLSGGEAQRLKIARELIQAGKKTGNKLYLLDEPTTGLHLEDVRVLIQVLDKLVDAGNTVVVIEHHLDVIKRADWVIDLGPEAGREGGLVMAQGPPETVATAPGSQTGRWLTGVLGSGTRDAGSGSAA